METLRTGGQGIIVIKLNKTLYVPNPCISNSTGAGMGMDNASVRLVGHHEKQIRN